MSTEEVVAPELECSISIALCVFSHIIQIGHCQVLVPPYLGYNLGCGIGQRSFASTLTTNGFSNFPIKEQLYKWL